MVDMELDPADYAALAEQALGLGKDIRTAYAEAAIREEEEEEVEDRLFMERAKEFADLHDEVESSTALLSSLETFLASFQSDLSAVSGEIGQLQEKSKAIEERLKTRRVIERPLSLLLTDLTIPPSLFTTIFDTDPSEAWLPAIDSLEKRLASIGTKGRVKASKELGDIAEACRNMAASKLRTFFLSLLNPLRTSTTTNIQVLQTSILLKYRPLFSFLQRHSPRVAIEVQRHYVHAARTYYETCFRRYARALGVIKARVMEKSELIGSTASSDSAFSLGGWKDATSPKKPALGTDSERLANASAEGGGIVLAYMADEREYNSPPEALFRSINLVLLDNACSEYAFLFRFFDSAAVPASTFSPSAPRSGLTSPTSELTSLSPTLSPRKGGLRLSLAGVMSPDKAVAAAEAAPLDDNASVTSFSLRSDADRFGGVGGGGAGVGAGRMEEGSVASLSAMEKAAVKGRGAAEEIWKQVWEPALSYWHTFTRSLLDPSPPPLIPLLTMIRLNDVCLSLCASRGCTPLETHLMGLKLELWPAFQKDIGAQVDSVKKLTGGVTSGGGAGAGAAAAAEALGVAMGMGGLMKAAGAGGSGQIKDSLVQTVCGRYAALFTSFVRLNDEKDEEMIFGSLLRMRTELEKLISAQVTKRADKESDRSRKQAHIMMMAETVLQTLSSGITSHPRLQAELSHWKEWSKG